MTIENGLPDDDGPVEIDLSKEADENKKGTEAVEVEVEPAPAPEAEDDGLAALKEQLNSVNAAAEEQRKRLAQEQQWRAQEHQARIQAERQARSAQEQGAQAQYDAILAGLGQSQAEIEAAEQDLESALEAQDAKLLAAAQRKLARAEVQLAQWENNKNAWEMHAEQYRQQMAAWQAQQEQLARQQQQPRQQQQQRPPALLDSEKEWLRQRPEAMNDPAKNRALQHAFNVSQTLGLARGSQEYFDYMEKALGYQKAAVPQKQEKPTTYAAPVSREVGGPAISGSKVHLSKEQREAARISGLTDAQYAKNLMAIEAAKGRGEIAN